MSKKSLLVRISELYYYQKLSQNEIGEILGVSRPTVSRLLEDAKNEGIVEIRINNNIEKNGDLSNKLRRKYNLREAIVVSGEYDHMEALEKCCTVGADFLTSILEHNDIVGINWGETITTLIDKLNYEPMHNVQIIQMIGCLSTGNPKMDGLEHSIKMAKKFDASYLNIYAPAFIRNPVVYDYLMNEPQIITTLKKASNVDVIITGIGTLENVNSTLSRYGHLTEEERQKFLSLGGVGHLVGRVFNKDGQEISLPNRDVISTELENFTKAKWSICVAFSDKGKKQAIISAIESNLINTLIVDEKLATELLRG